MNGQMEREKQIEEMAKLICNDTRCKTCIHRVEIEDCNATKIAKRLYNAGYRKERQGEWKPQMQELNYYDTFECSVCEFVIDVSQGDYKYCPNCGAQMKGN